MPKLSARLVWWIIIVVLLAAIAVVIALLVRPSQTSTSTGDIAALVTKGGQDTNVSKRGPQDDPDGHSFRTQYYTSIEQVAADLRSRINATDLLLNCTEGVQGLADDDMRRQVWQSLPAQTCTLAQGDHQYGHIWLVQYSSGGIANNGGAYIDVEGDLYR